MAMRGHRMRHDGCAWRRRRLFAGRRFADATVLQVTARAGLTTRTFLRHYTDSREVLPLRKASTDPRRAASGREDCDRSTAAVDVEERAVDSSGLVTRQVDPAAATASGGRIRP